MVSRRPASACSMRRSDHPSRPSARICCCVVSSKTLLMPATELAFLADVNVSIATGNGRFSAVDQWPVLGVHRGLQASPTDGLANTFVQLAQTDVSATVTEEALTALNDLFADPRA